MVETTPLAEALRAELQHILDSGPFTLQIARRIEEVADAASRMLKATGGVEQAIETVKHGQISDDQSIAYSSASETFGARLIRELMTMLPQFNAPKTSPKALVEAIAVAHQHGLTDLESDLTSKLDRYCDTQPDAQPDAQPEKPDVQPDEDPVQDASPAPYPWEQQGPLAESL
jgi:hypothetical protein